MTMVDIIRAWKDAQYRESLSDEQRALLPEHPAGLIELADAELETVAGAALPRTYATQCSDGWRCISGSWSCG